AVEATREAVDAWAEGRIDGRGGDVWVNRARAAFARLVGVRPVDVACGNQVSVFAALVAAAVPDGGEIVVAHDDFTSVVFPMLVAEQGGRGVRVRAVPLEEVPGAVSETTSLVAVSAAQSSDGRLVDLDALTAAADACGADVFLDATQAAGWLPIDASRFTYVACGTYKWLLSPRGTAFLAVRPEAAERLPPIHAGWYAADTPWTAVYSRTLEVGAGAKRFDISPAWPLWPATAICTELIADLGAEAIGAYDIALANRLRDGLGLPHDVTPFVIAERPDAAERLAAAGVKAAVRAGRVRIACHLPATAEDVDRAVAALA
ncbi:MAG TPA: aminotransferase class V-fold PLP-dependent enzyme, partial [Solirubrobacteraceae bacterium]|nr:aminotransferase class V-fold PLP-dependent enzyme [Solirubrobacteraceae bacterium]